MSIVFKFQRLLILVFLLNIGLLVSRISTPPSGYLHSWNQISTLAVIQSISNNFKNIFYPKDVVTLLSWDKTEIYNESNRFVIYEEFPLYHFLVACLSPNNYTDILVAKALSIIGWVLFVFCISQIASNVSSSELIRNFSVLSTLISFPVLYYGQATMSDMAMLALISCSFYYLTLPQSSRSNVTYLKATILLLFAGLFKSYAILFAPLLVIYAITGGKSFKFKVYGFVAGLTSTIPTIAWHIFASFQPGHQEFLSHSVPQKISVILSAELYTKVIHYVVKNIGIFSFVILVSWLLVNWKSLIKYFFKYWWLSPWLALSAGFILLTADKIPDHDYYFLVTVLPLFLATGASLKWAWVIANSVKRNRTILVVMFVLGIVTSYSLSVKSYLKATTPNYDVHDCADVIVNESEEHDLIATISTDQRYNALQYFSGRKGFSVQLEAYSILDYMNAGASYLIINARPEQYLELASSLNKQLKQVKGLKKLHKEVFKDFKGRERICEMYSLR